MSQQHGISNKGRYENTTLDGLNVVGTFHSHGNTFRGPKWRAALYLDEKASKEQADALGKIYSGQAGGFFTVLAGLIGEIAGVKSVPIKFEIDGKKRSLAVSSSLQMTIEGVEGRDKNNETTLISPPMLVTPGFPVAMTKSTKHSYNDHGMQWDNSGKNGLYSKFAYFP